MNQLCRVCGEPAAGFHFGAFTCEGCKSFFGRTYNNLSSISECKNNGECVINKKNRTSCKACRLRKCLMVGMSKSGSRYGRRSNWFKIHCLLQEQQQQQQQQHQQGGQPPSQLQQPAVSVAIKGMSPPLWGDPPRLRHFADADNNNKVLPDKHHQQQLPSHRASPAPLALRGLPQRPPQSPYGAAESAANATAAALWAARSSLLMASHPQMSPFAMPFLAPPYLQTGGGGGGSPSITFQSHHQQHRSNYFLPLVQSLPPPPKHFRQPQQQQVTVAERDGNALTLTELSSSSSSSSSSTPSPPPRLPTSDKTPELLLQSLGPVQEEPIDLSVRSGERGDTSARSSTSESSLPGLEEGVDEACSDSGGGGGRGCSEGGETQRQVSSARMTPLNLTARS